MVSLGSLVLGAVVSNAVSQKMNDNGSSERGEPVRKMAPRSNSPERGGNDALEELLAIERRQNPTANSIDSFAGETLNIPAGGKATVTVRPERGFDMRVKRVEYDRREDHTYTHHVGGVQVSNNHRVHLQSTRRLRHGDTVVSVVENNTGSSSVIDFEFEGWSIPLEER